MDLTYPCLCCLMRQSEKHLKTPYSHFGRTEIYSDMIQECFDIHVKPENVKKYGICEVCVDRLRDTNNFKLQVQRCQAQLLEYEVTKSNITENDTASIPAESWSEHDDVSEDLPLTKSQNRGPKGVVPHPCQICKKTFDSQSNLANHMKATHNGEGTGKSRDSFSDQFTMFCLETNSSNSRTKEVLSVLDRFSKPKFYKCDFCAMVFPTKVLLATHRRTHKAKKVHACHICNKIFKKKYLLTNHILVHKGEKPFSCERCEKRFTTKTGLLGHQRIHTSTDVFICDICNKKLTTKKSLILHIVAHNGIKPYVCQECDMKFTQRASLKEHQFYHTGQKQFECNLCNKQFRRKYYLRDHMNTHTEQKIFCEHCGKNFTCNTYLRKHIRKAHS